MRNAIVTTRRVVVHSFFSSHRDYSHQRKSLKLPIWKTPCALSCSQAVVVGLLSSVTWGGFPRGGAVIQSAPPTPALTRSVDATRSLAGSPPANVFLIPEETYRYELIPPQIRATRVPPTKQSRAAPGAKSAETNGRSSGTMRHWWSTFYGKSETSREGTCVTLVEWGRLYGGQVDAIEGMTSVHPVLLALVRFLDDVLLFVRV
jgi:hypothetical protein